MPGKARDHGVFAACGRIRRIEWRTSRMGLFENSELSVSDLSDRQSVAKLRGVGSR
jgi:hypothetical protein